jgi:hypothetical protein
LPGYFTAGTAPTGIGKRSAWKELHEAAGLANFRRYFIAGSHYLAYFEGGV